MSNEVPKPIAHDASEAGPGRLALTLGLAGLLCGVAIVIAYEATRSTIAENRATELREAVFKVLPSTSSFRTLCFAAGELKAACAAGDGDDIVYAGYDGRGRLTGYAIPAEGPGWQDTIRLLYGYLPKERLIVGMEVLESRETPGLGDKIYKDADFRRNFERLETLPEIVAVKKGRRAAANEVDAITGATISSAAVVGILNSANRTWGSRLMRVGEAVMAGQRDDAATGTTQR